MAKENLEKIIEVKVSEQFVEYGFINKSWTCGRTQ